MVEFLKKGVKILGIACSSFNRMKEKEIPLVGIVIRGATILEGVMQSSVTVDGEDATNKIVELVQNSTHKDQLKMIMTRGVTVAGFNYIDIKELFYLTSLPIISIVDHNPDMKKIRLAIQNVSNWEKRFEKISQCPIRSVQTTNNDEPVFVQSIGIEEKKIDKFLKEITIVGRIPEPIRVARLIALAFMSQH
ncbi:MAG TPA: DUF99 family protein [candidate division Zixibacteria bacterium]|nr:DUF99 family protein [candidate division Zixibacteria bacterium]